MARKLDNRLPDIYIYFAPLTAAASRRVDT